MSKKKQMPRVLFAQRVVDDDGDYFVSWHDLGTMLDACDHGEEVGVYELKAVRKTSVVRSLKG